MEFACNPKSASAFSAALTQRLASASGVRWLLIDTALLPEGSAADLAARMRLPLANALLGSALESFGQHAPHVLALPDDPARLREVLERFLKLDPRAPAFSVLESDAELSQLTKLFGYLALATVDCDLEVHCRFADTRVLPHLLNCLLPVQSALISQVVQRWYWADHLSAPQMWRRRTSGNNESPLALSAASNLELSNGQFSAMLAASEPDTVFYLLLDNTPELVPKTERGNFRDQLQRVLGLANKFKLTTPNDRLQFSILSLSCGEDFHARAVLTPTWHAIAAGGSTLEAEMKKWTDAVWDDIQSAQVHE